MSRDSRKTTAVQNGANISATLASAPDRSGSPGARPLRGFALHTGKAGMFERRRRVHARADSEAKQFEHWRDQVVMDMQEQRTNNLRLYHAAMHFILTHSLNHPLADLIADECEYREARYFALDDEIDAFRRMTRDEQVQLYQENMNRRLKVAS